VSALYQSTNEAQVSNNDHAMIGEALAKGQSAEAERLMREHIHFLEARLDATLANNVEMKKKSG
jgi:DNA-binding GntR family transcriptional regulator